MNQQRDADARRRRRGRHPAQRGLQLRDMDGRTQLTEEGLYRLHTNQPHSEDDQDDVGRDRQTQRRPDSLAGSGDAAHAAPAAPARDPQPGQQARQAGAGRSDVPQAGDRHQILHHGHHQADDQHRRQRPPQSAQAARRAGPPTRRSPARPSPAESLWAAPARLTAARLRRSMR